MCCPVVVKPPPSTRGLAAGHCAVTVLLADTLDPEVALTTTMLPGGMVAAAAGVAPPACTPSSNRPVPMMTDIRLEMPSKCPPAVECRRCRPGP